LALFTPVDILITRVVVDVEVTPTDPVPAVSAPIVQNGAAGQVSAKLIVQAVGAPVPTVTCPRLLVDPEVIVGVVPHDVGVVGMVPAKPSLALIGRSGHDVPLFLNKLNRP